MYYSGSSSKWTGNNICLKYAKNLKEAKLNGLFHFLYPVRKSEFSLEGGGIAHNARPQLRHWYLSEYIQSISSFMTVFPVVFYRNHSIDLL